MWADGLELSFSWLPQATGSFIWGIKVTLTIPYLYCRVHPSASWYLQMRSGPQCLWQPDWQSISLCSIPLILGPLLIEKRATNRAHWRNWYKPRIRLSSLRQSLKRTINTVSDCFYGWATLQDGNSCRTQGKSRFSVNQINWCFLLTQHCLQAPSSILAVSGHGETLGLFEFTLE